MQSSKLSKIRNLMLQYKIDAYLIPSTDEHNNEYVPKCFQRRAWISDFDGSSGDAIVTQNSAILFTDGRYFLQAENQLSHEFTLVKCLNIQEEIQNWILKNIIDMSFGLDSKLLSIQSYKQIEETLSKNNSTIVPIKKNLVDICIGDIFINQKPPFEISEKFTGLSAKEKLLWTQTEIKKYNADYLILTCLDEIAWLFNMRGYDIDYMPVAIGYAIIGINSASLYLRNNSSINLNISCLNYLNYDEFFYDISILTGKVLLDKQTANYYVFSQLNVAVVFIDSPIMLKKAQKNITEICGTKEAHKRDAVAVIKFLHWLENNSSDEITASQELLKFRAEQVYFHSESFASISAFAENSAVIHYHPTIKTNKKIDKNNIYLIDSGGQYFDGTTDITRTVHLGIPTEEQKKHYTLVLKGHLALTDVIFPAGTSGEQLDALARYPLWQNLLDYNHGTGHGVGSFLGVHEGPQRISHSYHNTPLLDGMIISNEPGLYFDGLYGIRIENLCIINTINEKFLKFQNLTMVPYCKKLIQLSMLNNEEIAKIIKYYEEIKTFILPFLNGVEKQWLGFELQLLV